MGEFFVEELFRVELTIGLDKLIVDSDSSLKGLMEYTLTSLRFEEVHVKLLNHVIQSILVDRYSFLAVQIARRSLLKNFI